MAFAVGSPVQNILETYDAFHIYPELNFAIVRAKSV